MIVDLDQLASDEERLSGRQVISFEDVAGEENRIDCSIELYIRRVAETYYIHVDAAGSLETACHRCLAPTTLPLGPSFDLVVQRASTRGAGPAEYEDLIYLPQGESELVLDQHIYENLLVNIPIQIVCDEGCKGLCSGCGVNLNQGECICTPAADTRWDALKKIKGNLPSNS